MKLTKMERETLREVAKHGTYSGRPKTCRKLALNGLLAPTDHFYWTAFYVSEDGRRVLAEMEAQS